MFITNRTNFSSNHWMHIFKDDIILVNYYTSWTINMPIEVYAILENVGTISMSIKNNWNDNCVVHLINMKLLLLNYWARQETLGFDASQKQFENGYMQPALNQNSLRVTRRFFRFYAVCCSYLSQALKLWSCNLVKKGL